MYVPPEDTAQQVLLSQIKPQVKFAQKVAAAFSAAKITNFVLVGRTKMKRVRLPARVAALHTTALQELLQRSCVPQVVIVPPTWRSMLFASLVHILPPLGSQNKVSALRVLKRNSAMVEIS